MNKVKNSTILFVTHYQGMYGANKSMCRLILELRDNYNINPVVLLRMDGSICDFLVKNHIRYIVSPFYWWVFEGKGLKQRTHNILKQIRNFSRVNKIIQKLEGIHIDLVYSNSITINIGIQISRRLNCRHLWYIRETLTAYGFKFSLGNMASKYILKQGADRYVVISEYLKKWYSHLLPPDKVIMIYNGIEPSFPLRKLNSYNIHLNLCILGILSNQKNQMEALKALDLIINTKRIDNVRLHLIGGKRDDYFHLLERFIEEKGLKNYVVFHGHIDNVYNLLQGMNLGLVSACDEGFGRVTIEYMINRMPVIVSNSGANTELIEQGLNGEIYPLGNFMFLANKIETFVKNPLLLEQMGTKAQEYALVKFSSAQNTEAIYQVIEELITE